MNAKPHGLAWPAAALGVLLAAGVGIAFDAERQRLLHRQAQPDVQAVVRWLGTADMALSSASRWLRHPSLSEPGAAFADAPAILDADPAGAMIAPPRAVLTGTLPQPATPLTTLAQP
jgi:hypothetical protein